MLETNKSYRIKTVANGMNDGFISIDTNLIQDYDTLDILSIKLNSSDMYRLHNSNYGVVVGRVLANNGFGVPNAKISIFITADGSDGEEISALYPFISSNSKDENGVRYNLLPDEKVDDCHQIVGTFPNKRYMLDNDVVLEVYDKYYKYTTRTNNSGDYLIMGAPVGSHTLHMDLDLSDCGILSQKPRDFVYKGYTIEQFETPTMFKSGTNYGELSQIFSQDQIITVKPFWGNESLGEPIGVTRTDINVAFKFEPTCVFIGCVAGDNSSNGITKKCKATTNMGNMEELTTGSGTIEMIRKTPTGEIESFPIRGTQLINGDGVWCYQIPMNLDYMMTDEYGNMVPTDDPNKGIPTRTSVRFRISMQDNEENLSYYYRAKVLVPHNPQVLRDGTNEGYDYEFGTFTREESFRDLFWDNVYTVKSYIPRFQKKKVRGWRDKHFTGIKNCNFYGGNNPMPYNNIRIKLPLMFTIMCAIIKCIIFLTSVFNTVINYIGLMCAKMGGIKIVGWRPFQKMWDAALNMKLNVVSEGLCPDLENWYFSPILGRKIKKHKKYNLLKQTLEYLNKENGFYDEKAIDFENSESEDEVVCLTTKTDYLISCVEMNLAMEYRVINFDFYNDWINGLIYIPRFQRYVRPKRKFLGMTITKSKLRACMDDTKVFAKTRRYTQQCSIEYLADTVNSKNVFVRANSSLNSSSTKGAIRKANQYHKKGGFKQYTIFGNKGGICHEHTTSRKEHVYYMKPCEWINNNTYLGKVNLFATDIVLLGSLKTCDNNGLPQAFKYLSSTSYVMPTNLALTNMETNGYLYANDKNTVCAGKSNQLITDDTTNDNGVQRVSSNISLSTELSMYQNSEDSNVDAQYDGNELSDIIALTESAGISWNYTGPGQGEVNPSVLYYPGGHFLGLSCVNSESNIKSCINLSRICEVGAMMSQRKEDVAYVKDNNGEDELVYYYTAPTGFISGNDINGEDFRTMFATMNQNRLKAVKYNPETGYYYYDFEFVKPINFNGAFKNIVKKGKNNYNFLPEGDNTLVPEITKEDINRFNGFGINTNFNERPDWDDNEIAHTQTKTYETTSVDYYRFRFGLMDNDLKQRNNKYHKSKFLSSSGQKKSLPQYENSFYFYFGMKDGASAIDEFNKQFYSTCETSIILQKKPTIEAKIEDINICNATGVVKIILDNIETPTTLFKCYTDKGDGTTTVALKDLGENTLNNNKYTHEFELDFGTYHFEIVDANGEILTTDIAVGVDLFTYDINVFDFNINNAMSKIKNGRESNNMNEFLGGYIEVSNVKCDDFYVNDIKSAVTISIDGVNMYNDERSGTVVFDNYENGDKSVILYVNSANTRYNLYLTYGCDSFKNSKQKIFLQTFEVRDGSSIELRMGFDSIPFYANISSNREDCFLTVPIDKFDNNGNKFIKVKDVNTPLLFGNISNNERWTSFIDSTNDYIEADKRYTLNNWLKRLSIIKTTDENYAFSNNVYASHGDKVIWGVPQNEEGVHSGKTIYCSEDDVDKYQGYSLDDDSSLHQTPTSCEYSAIAVDEDIVSGDFFAYLNEKTIYRGEAAGCYGRYPAKNTGYVFKSLPDGELYYYIYDGTLNYNKDSKKGVFYSSFQYPVVNKKFNVDIDFYIWEGISIERDENTDADAIIKFQDLAGRTELKIDGGIRYNGKFGALDNSAGFSVSNIVNNLGGTNITDNSSLILSDMTVTYTEEIPDTEEARMVYTPAFTVEKNGKYTKGVAGISDVYYEISEGYPVVSEETFGPEFKDVNFDFSELIKTASGSFNYAEYFSDYITYEFKPGLGIVLTPKGESRYGSFYYDDFWGYQHSGKICAANKSGILYLPEGNNRYIYFKTGDKRPTYYVLCKYKQHNASDSIPGDLCILKIDYYTNRRFRIFWSYLKKDDSASSGSTDYVTMVEKVKHAGGSKRNSLNWLLNRNGEKYGRNFYDYMEPVKNYQIKVDNNNWITKIENDEAEYKNNILPASALSGSYTYYFVDKYMPSENIDSFHKMTLYKIYPVLFEQVDKEEGDIKLGYYAAKMKFSGKNYGYVPTVEFWGYSWSSVVEGVDSTSYYGNVTYNLEYGDSEGEGTIVSGQSPTKHHLYLMTYPKSDMIKNNVNITIEDVITSITQSNYTLILSATTASGERVYDFSISNNITSAATTDYCSCSVGFILTIYKGDYNGNNTKEFDDYLMFSLSSGDTDGERFYIHRDAMIDYFSKPSDWRYNRYSEDYSFERLGLVENEFDEIPNELSAYRKSHVLVLESSGKTKGSLELKALHDVNERYNISAITIDYVSGNTDIFYNEISGKTKYNRENSLAYITTYYNYNVPGGVNSAYTIYEMKNNNPILLDEPAYNSYLVVYRKAAEGSAISFTQQEIVVPYYYENSNDISVGLETNFDVSNTDISIKWENGYRFWTLKPTISNKLVKFKVNNIDNEWGYYDSENNLQKDNTLIASYEKDGSTLEARIKVIREPYVSFNINKSNSISSNITINISGKSVSARSTHDLSVSGITNIIPKLSNDDKNMELCFDISSADSETGILRLRPSNKFILKTYDIKSGDTFSVNTQLFKDEKDWIIDYYGDDGYLETRISVSSNTSFYTIKFNDKQINLMETSYEQKNGLNYVSTDIRMPFIVNYDSAQTYDFKIYHSGDTLSERHSIQFSFHPVYHGYSNLDPEYEKVEDDIGMPGAMQLPQHDLVGAVKEYRAGFLFPLRYLGTEKNEIIVISIEKHS